MFEQDDSDEIVLLTARLRQILPQPVMNYYIHEVPRIAAAVIGGHQGARY